MSSIVDVVAREILDSRGNPTVEADVLLEQRKDLLLGSGDGQTGRPMFQRQAVVGCIESFRHQ